MIADAALAFTLKWEGGYVNDPDDPGGATNQGITQHTYDQWRVRHRQGFKPVKDIGEAEVKAIYDKLYWQEAGCGKLCGRVAIAHFDAAVNVGPSQAIKFLQRASGTRDDGVFGPLTLKAVEAAEEPKLFHRLLEERREFYRNLVKRKPKMGKFLNGWLNRVDALEKL